MARRNTCGSPLHPCAHRAIQWQRDMVKDNGSCTHRFIHRLNWSVLSVDEIEQIKIKYIKYQTNTKDKQKIYISIYTNDRENQKCNRQISIKVT